MGTAKTNKRHKGRVMSKKVKKSSGPKVLLFDIETAPIIAYVWGLWDQNVGLNQIKKDWHVLSWSAKWLGEKEMMYADQRHERDISNDKKILKKMWDLLNEADIVITQNGIKFDVKKLNARFIIHGFKPPSPFKHIDTLRIAKSKFGFSSNRLEYMANTLQTKTKKLSRREFDGFDLWRECLAGNIRAWKEMEVYNKADVLALEQVYEKLAPWDNSINFNLYRDSHACNCGSKNVRKNGFFVATAGKYQRYMCNDCGTWTRGSENLFSKDRRQSLKRKIT